MLPCPLKETLLSQYPQQWMGTIYTTRFFVHEKFWNMHGTLKINLYIIQWWKVIPWKFHGWDFYMNMLWNFYGNIFVYETFTFHIWPKMNIAWILCETCMKLIVHFIHKKPVVIIYQLITLATVISSMRKGVATKRG